MKVLEFLSLLTVGMPCFHWLYYDRGGTGIVFGWDYYRSNGGMTFQYCGGMGFFE
jgi:hypothetical protein